MELEAGVQLGPLRIERELGRGAYGIVYLAENTLVGRRVALKVLPGREGSVSADLRAEVLSEARMLGNLNSPHIVRLYRLHPTDDGVWTQEMEFLEGGSLDDILEDDTPLPLDRAVRIFRAICLALKAAHGVRIIHGDIKCANVLLGKRGQIKLADFGLARKIVGGEVSIPLHGEAYGSPRYMPPEVISGSEAGIASDLWSSAVLFYRLLTGRFPFPAQYIGELIQKVMTADPEPFGPDVPEPLADLVRRCLVKDMSERMSSAEAVVDELDRLAMQDARLVPAPTEQPTNWTPSTDTFVGRETDLDELLASIDEAPLVTITGPGGVGKTRIADQLCGRLLSRYPGGCWVVDLAETSDAPSVAHTVAEALGVRLESDADPVEQVADVLQYRDAMLLLLDNFEQVREHAEETVGAWIARAPQMQFLVTSREDLGIAGERVHRLGPLRSPPTGSGGEHDPQEARVHSAVRLFEDRARAVDAAFSLDAGNVHDVVRICRGLDGMPLAIELAAARMDAMTPGQVAERLGEKFRMLESSRGDIAQRQRSLDRAIEWSYELLEDWEKEAFLQACYFRDTFDVDAMERVLDLSAFPDRPDTVTIARCLRNKSLITAELGIQTRLSMFRAIKDYGRQKWRDSIDAERRGALAKRHADYYLAFADEWNRLIPGARDQEALDRIAREIGNLSRVLEWGVDSGDAELAARAAVAMAETMKVRHPPGQLAPLLSGALDALEEERPDLRVKLHIHLSATCQASGDWDHAVTNAERAVSMARGLGDERTLAEALVQLGEMQRNRGQLADALVSLRESEEHAKSVGERGILARGTGDRGMVLGRQGDFDGAWECFGRAQEIAREIGDHQTEAMHLCNRGVVCESRGEPEQALALYGEAEEIARRIGNRLRVAVALGNQANVYVQRGDAEAGLLCYREAEAIARELGAKQRIAHIVGNRGTAHAMWGELDHAVACFEEAEAIARELGDQRRIAMSLAQRGNLQSRRGEYREAIACFRQAEQIGHDIGDRTIVARNLGQRGSAYLSLERLDDAREALQAAIAMYDEMHANQSGWYLTYKAALARVAAARNEMDTARRLALEGLALADQLGVDENHPSEGVRESVVALRSIQDGKGPISP
ncbi:MAG: protein kinase domain-containing protein [Planctomycetota bacterium]|jgi:non-specific serine/threonine protein kinase